MKEGHFSFTIAGIKRVLERKATAAKTNKAVADERENKAAVKLEEKTQQAQQVIQDIGIPLLQQVQDSFLEGGGVVDTQSATLSWNSTTLEGDGPFLSDTTYEDSIHLRVDGQGRIKIHWVYRSFSAYQGGGSSEDDRGLDPTNKNIQKVIERWLIRALNDYKPLD